MVTLCLPYHLCFLEMYTLLAGHDRHIKVISNAKQERQYQNECWRTQVQ